MLLLSAIGRGREGRSQFKQKRFGYVVGFVEDYVALVPALGHVHNWNAGFDKPASSEMKTG